MSIKVAMASVVLVTLYYNFLYGLAAENFCLANLQFNT
ncbi:MAG: hypothetical protein OFPI_34910 [Osedax symbiont Rs2]|nr:MAG: hypothetical protein OFPI_34910 [Osedax symbiont Rs2]